MSDLGALYQEVILDHNRKPRNFHEMEGATAQAEERNPLCGDEFTVWLKMEHDVISDVSFVGRGCAISKASASMMTTAIKGKSRMEAERLFERFHDLVTAGPVPKGEADAELGRLKVFAGVARFPTRVKCASLAWKALRHALASESKSSDSE